MNGVNWRVYMIYDENDFAAALRRYEAAVQQKPRCIAVSERAPAEIERMAAESGLLLAARRADILPRDVWLTHETAFQPGLL